MRQMFLKPVHALIASKYDAWVSTTKEQRAVIVDWLYKKARKEFDFIRYEQGSKTWSTETPRRVRKIINNHLQEMRKRNKHQISSGIPKIKVKIDGDKIFGRMVEIMCQKKQRMEIQKAALDSDESTVRMINGGVIEMFLEPPSSNDQDSTCLKCNEREESPQADKDSLFFDHWQEKHERDIPSRSTICTFIRQELHKLDKTLDTYKLANLAILAKFDVEGPQPTHMDCPQNYDEKFGVLVLTKSSKGTIIYNMDNVPLETSASSIKKFVWKDAPDELIQNLDHSLISSYGRLLRAIPERRPKEKTVDQYSLVVMNGGHPHCAPSNIEPRIVLFFTLSGNQMDVEQHYDGDVQLSREKLTFLLYERMVAKRNTGDESVKSEHLEYLLKKTGSYVAETAQFGSTDTTLTFDDPKIEKKRVDIVRTYLKVGPLLERGRMAINTWAKMIQRDDDHQSDESVE